MVIYSNSSLFKKKEVKVIINIFEKAGAELRFVGGCVRDTILEREIIDIDCATNIKPELIIKILKKNNIIYDDFAKKYGSVKAYLNKQKFEITSLRRDINQQGRETDIVYTDNWELDAERRDFTFNAIYLSSNGQLKDFFNGVEDLKNNKVRFIGKIEDSIQEDYLRIFRFYRFLGVFKNPVIIKSYDKILSDYCEKSFNYLSNDLIRREILKMFNSTFPLNSFFKNIKTLKKKQWVYATKKHFIKTDYDLGINRCLNRIDLMLN